MMQRVWRPKIFPAMTTQAKIQESSTTSSRRLADMAEEAELMRRVQRGDPHAFEELYARLYRPALVVAGRTLRDPGQAEEAVQEALVYAWRNAARYDADRGSVRTWVLTTVASRAIDVRRRDARHLDQRDYSEHHASLVEDPARTDQQTESKLEQTEREGQLRGAMGDLPMEQREALFRHYYETLTYAEIASASGVPEATVKSRARLGLGKLKGAVPAPA
jgi:RNA polymerase sigma-70 factor (ECF subfamily)